MNRAKAARRRAAGLPRVPACWAWCLPACHPYTLDVVYEWQAGRCAVCGLPGNLTPDHDHDTGLMRGWLCDGCNRAEGRRGGVFAMYRHQPPCAILDVRVRYSDSGRWLYRHLRAG